MKYLLDVSSLIAFGLQTHQFHRRTVAWVRSQTDATLLTCSITELGFVRILAQVPNYGLSVATSRELLLQLKETWFCGLFLSRTETTFPHFRRG
jgi:predicted nucleic acid-binding protein